jgi:hypothetical protein
LADATLRRDFSRLEARLKLRPTAFSAVELIPQGSTASSFAVTSASPTRAGAGSRHRQGSSTRDGSARDDPWMRAASTYRRSERKRSKGGRRTAGGRREGCDELSTRTQRNHRLVRHPEDCSAHPLRLLAHACANAACANQPSIRLVVTEQKGPDMKVATLRGPTILRRRTRRG